MYLFIKAQILTINGWQLLLAAVTMIISFVLLIWKIDRARKKDFKTEIEKKADIIHVNSELKNRDEKINTIRVKLEEHEKNNISQFVSIKDNLEEILSVSEHTNQRIDKIFEMLSKKR